ncbi:type I restriction endonuclease subunit S [Burkholderia stagnalis]|uniref:Restriction endonuclease subunit S n=1 Tax=Burkholderia stagnalis TaxID=1503054 RepID=A0A6L3MK08_9BURK|nr:restriction endonuclease subunit S [Burkholderia stagnalis]KAB0631205.1 restriction endonuclease subunit S [Burkholderia stagnalis]KVO41429.1 type I restriction endonuclease subunit S [Burkholderia stagnalis]KVO69445.1 type I restriction endonuclease subunit S [Burkholderia stagnalis]KVW69654.1 type I restriction endonuclease subunit S [Burkholderia stagnalis]KVW87340.1 type I restriction endonuclease subunit S [Burkholderia stagnalis]
MNKESNQKRVLTPRLRFPEFRDAGGWGSEFGDKVFDQISNKDHNSDLPVLAITQEHGAIPRNLIDYHVSVADKSIEGYKVVEVGDFIISLRSFQGGIEYSKYQGICSPAYVILRLKHGHSADYFRQFLKTDRFIIQLNKNLEGLRDGKMVSYKQFSELILPVPSQAEQQKIADCLSFLGELLAAENQKLDTLRAYKKALMQQLFPIEGETVPRLRFPEFRDAEDWEENTLGNLVEIISGKSPSQYQLGWDGMYPFVKVEDLNNCDKYQAAAREYSDDTDGLVPRDSVIFPKRGAAIALNKIRLSDRELLMDTNMMALTPREVCRADFLFYYLSQIGLSQIADSSTIPQINNKHIIPFHILVPLPEEQKRIADCLSSLDDLITVESKKLDTIKFQKKGLMQKLLPVLDEVRA